MSTLVAIGYPDETTASAAAEEARRRAAELVIQPEAIAVISRDAKGTFQVSTTHHAVEGGGSWGMFWGFLFGFLFFIPVLGMAVGAGLRPVMGRVARIGIDKQFQDQVRNLLQPGTSALFLVVDQVAPDRVVDGLTRYGGTAFKSALRPEPRMELQEALNGLPTVSTVPDL